MSWFQYLIDMYQPIKDIYKKIREMWTERHCKKEDTEKEQGTTPHISLESYEIELAPCLKINRTLYESGERKPRKEENDSENSRKGQSTK